MYNAGNPMVHVNFRMLVKERDNLNALAVKRGISVSELVRNALAQYFMKSSLLTGTTPDGRPYALHGTVESVEAVSDMIEAGASK